MWAQVIRQGGGHVGKVGYRKSIASSPPQWLCSPLLVIMAIR